MIENTFNQMANINPVQADTVQKTKTLRPHQFYRLAREFSTKEEFETYWSNGAAKGWSKSTIYTRKDGNLVENFRLVYLKKNLMIIGMNISLKIPLFRCSSRLCKNMLRIVYPLDNQCVQVECTFEGKHEDFHNDGKKSALNNETKKKIMDMYANGRKARWIYFHLVVIF